MKKPTKRPVLVTDTHRGIYFGHLVKELEGGNAVLLEGARHCFSYVCLDDHNGVYGLATGGPGPGSYVGPRVSMKIRDVATIVNCTAEAVIRWEDASWGK